MPGGGYDTAGHGHDTAGRAHEKAEEAYNTTRNARPALPGEDVAIQSLYRELDGPWVAIQKNYIMAEEGDFGS